MFLQSFAGAAFAFAQITAPQIRSVGGLKNTSGYEYHHDDVSAKQSTSDQEMKWDPNEYQNSAGYVATLGEPLLGMLAVQPGENILDLGCGDGALTEKIAGYKDEKKAFSSPSQTVTVVGVDASSDQVEAAKLRGLDARVMDGHDLSAFESSSFDGVLSNAALHWMKRDPDAVIKGVHRLLRPGGRFVGEMGGYGNVDSIRKAIQASLRKRGIDGSVYDPWYFPSVQEYRKKLESAGFHVLSIELFERPTPIESIRRWMDLFLEPLLQPFEENQRDNKNPQSSERNDILNEVEQTVRTVLWSPQDQCDKERNDGQWIMDYVRLRFHAVKSSKDS